MIQHERERLERFLKTHSADTIRQIARDRLEGKDSWPILSGGRDECPTDLVTALLKEKLPPQTRQAVVDACKEVAGNQLNIIACSKIPEPKDIETLDRLCSVLDRASPPELFGHANALFIMVEDRLAKMNDLPEELLSCVARAVFRYRLAIDDAHMWKRLVECDKIASYAFNALSLINPTDPELVTVMVKLWRRVLHEGWTFDLPYLMRGAESKTSGFIDKVLETLSEMDIWPEAITVLRKREWSAKWLERYPTNG